MLKRYLIPDLLPGAAHTAQIAVRRSRFLAALGHGPDIDSARAFIQAQRRRHADATHNCWAFCAGPPGDTGRVAFSDDGEPQGTAGRPMLAVLLRSEVGELACVVTRWFGGVKLGTAGLVAAYREAVSAALAELPVRMRMERIRVLVSAEYRHVDMIRRVLPAHEAHIEKEDFSERANIIALLPEEQIEAFTREVLDGSGGRTRVTPHPEPLQTATK